MKNSEIGSFIAGIGATEDIDSSGEVIEIKGIDHSSLCKDGRLNYEHKSENNSQVIGKIIDCKKILKESDCEHELHKRFWEKARKRPYLYVAAVLYDKMGHSGAKDALAQFKFDQHIDQDKTNGANWLSIEGSRLGKEGNRIKKCVARDFAATFRPCNKSCLAELLTDEEADKFIPSIAKKKVQESMKKSMEEESDLKKSDRKYFKELGDAKQAKIGQQSSTRDYTPITPATGEHREGKPAQPKRTFSSMADAPEKMKVGDRILHDKKPRAKGGKAFYRDLYKDLDNPVRKGIMKKNEKEIKKSDLYNIHVHDKEKGTIGAKINEKPMTLKDIHEKHGGVKKLENSGYRIMPHSEPPSVKKSEDLKKAKVDENMAWGEKRKARRARNEAGREQKGVHRQIAIGERGESKARPYKAPASVERQLPGTNASYKKRSLDAHNKVIQEQKEMPKPNLPKSERNEILKSLANEAWDNFKHKDLLIETIKKTEPELSEAEVIGIAKTFAYMDMKKKESEIEDMFEKNKDGRCWEGYEPVKGKKAYSKGSCAPIRKARVDEGKKPDEKIKAREKRRDEENESRPNTFTPTPLSARNMADPEVRAGRKGDPKRQRSVITAVGIGTKDDRIKAHKQKIKDIKRVNPDLPKSEEMNKNEELESVIHSKLKGWDISHENKNKLHENAKNIHQKTKNHSLAAELAVNDALDSGHLSYKDDKGRKVVGKRTERHGKSSKEYFSKSEEIDKKEKPFHNYNPSKHSKEGGLNDKERKRINREEGSNLKRPVTGKVKAGSKAAKRKKSFCARMSGNKGPTSKDGKLTPKGAALKRWNCNKNEE
jgi:hypothetical protein